ncbi:MAG: hypothetical protein MPJ52_02925 [Alphaproteobacteria bacterium]|nr:hypothetical protein [Alphaproteobacteria bacterium]
MSKGNRNGDGAAVNIADILNDDDGDNDGDEKGGGVVVNVMDNNGDDNDRDNKSGGVAVVNVIMDNNRDDKGGSVVVVNDEGDKNGGAVVVNVVDNEGDNNGDDKGGDVNVSDDILTAGEMARAKKHFRQHEGVVEYPYLDSRGLVTIGVGFLIPDIDTCAKLPLLYLKPDGGTRPATSAEKREGYTALRAETDAQQQNPRAASHWKSRTQLRASEDWMELRLARELNTRAAACARIIGDAWNELNSARRLVLMDVHYATGSLSGFPSLVKAARRNDGETMARESVYHSGIAPDGSRRRNWSRLLSNFALCLGQDENDGAVAAALRDRLAPEQPPEWIQRRARSHNKKQ